MKKEGDKIHFYCGHCNSVEKVYKTAMLDWDQFYSQLNYINFWSWKDSEGDVFDHGLYGMMEFSISINNKAKSVSIKGKSHMEFGVEVLPLLKFSVSKLLSDSLF